jgi:hypothetical protein
MADTQIAHNGHSPDAPVAELLKQLSDQASRLARQEVALAKVELAEKGKQAGVGAGMFGGAGVFAFYALGALTTAAILGLATGVAGWLAAIVVAGVLAAIAGVLALQGKTRIKEAAPPVPERATESTKEDVQWMKARAQEARR